MEYLTNRDLAIIFWLVPFVGFLLYKKEVRESLFQVLRAATHPKIASIIGFLAIYVAGVSYTLWLIGFWDISLAKATILWTFASGIAGIFEFSKKRRVQNFFVEGIRAQFGVIIFVEYVATLKAFSLWFELVSLPILTFLGLMQAFAQNNEEHKSVENALTWLLAVFGIFLIISGLYIVWADPGFWNVATLKDFLLPIILSITILPFFYLLIVYSTFEIRFIGIEYRIEDITIQKRAKWSAFWKYIFDLEGLDRWFYEIQITKVQSASELTRTFERVREQKNIERNPPIVSPEIGWSPYSAMKFPDDVSLHCEHYKQEWKDSSNWYANSNYLKLDKSILGNQLSYGVEGTSEAVTRLTLNLDVQDKSKKQLALEFLSERLSMVLESAGIKPEKEILNSVKAAKDKSVNTTLGKVKISRTDWPNDQAFDLNVDIIHRNHQLPS